MNRKVLGALLTALLAGSAPAFAAGTCNGCRIKMLGAGPYFDSICSSGSCIFIDIEQAVTGKPGCSTNSSWDFVLDISTASGRSTYALLIAASAAGQSINISGNNYCSLSPSGVVENFFFVTHAG